MLAQLHIMPRLKVKSRHPKIILCQNIYEEAVASPSLQNHEDENYK